SASWICRCPPRPLLAPNGSTPTGTGPPDDSEYERVPVLRVPSRRPAVGRTARLTAVRRTSVERRAGAGGPGSSDGAARLRRAHRTGLSGNPQRRAQQLRQARRAGPDRSASWHPQADPDRAALGELAYHLAGGALPEAWWRESHERILAVARALTWPARRADLETQACQIIGDEFYDRMHSPGTGLHPAQWLRALAEETGVALRAMLARGADDWQKLWALLCGLALTAPRTPANAVEE